MSIRRETPVLLKRLGDYECYQRITSISLDGPKTTDEVIPYLVQLRQLGKVEFGPTTKVSEGGIRKLREALPKSEIHSSWLRR